MKYIHIFMKIYTIQLNKLNTKMFIYFYLEFIFIIYLYLFLLILSFPELREQSGNNNYIRCPRGWRLSTQWGPIEAPPLSRPIRLSA